MLIFYITHIVTIVVLTCNLIHESQVHVYLPNYFRSIVIFSLKRKGLSFDPNFFQKLACPLTSYNYYNFLSIYLFTCTSRYILIKIYVFMHRTRRCGPSRHHNSKCRNGNLGNFNVPQVFQNKFQMCTVRGYFVHM